MRKTSVTLIGVAMAVTASVLAINLFPDQVYAAFQEIRSWVGTCVIGYGSTTPQEKK